jgi:predicted DNA-binding protein with PD1-like motif
MSLIALLILVIGGFMAFKYIGTSMEKKQIKKEIFDTVGTVRGGELGNAEVAEIIENILKRSDIEILELSTDVNRSTNVIHYHLKYRIETDYLLFKKSEIVEVNEQIENYG